MTAKELKKLYGVLDNKNISVIGFINDGKTWWHIHDDEEVPEKWCFGLKELPDKTEVLESE